jgi:hypothetical protein
MILRVDLVDSHERDGTPFSRRVTKVKFRHIVHHDEPMVSTAT